MMRFLADENFNNKLLRGLKEENPEIDVIRVQDSPVYQKDDPTVLEWAAQEGRILLTHDVQTMTNHAFERVNAGLPMPCVIEVNEDIQMGHLIEELTIIFVAGTPSDFENQVRYVPLR